MSGKDIRGGGKMIITKIIQHELKRQGFASFLIYGPQGSGRTTLALLAMKEIYGSWDDALKHTYFNLESLIADLKEAFQKGERIPVILIDDAEIVFSVYQEKKELVQSFWMLFETMRDVVSSIIFVSEETDDFVKNIKPKMKYAVYIKRLNDKKSIAMGYELSYKPSGKIHAEKRFEITFPLCLPPKVRERYKKMREPLIKQLCHTSF